jgi:hypothetical protein
MVCKRTDVVSALDGINTTEDGSQEASLHDLHWLDMVSAS